MDACLEPPPSPLRRTIHVVDDDAQTRELLSDYLERHGMTVRAMDSAEALLAALGAVPPDLVVLGVGLPGMSGLEACRGLREAGYDVPVLMLSSLTDVIDRVVGLEVGADDYLCKPFATRELLARINALLRRAQGLVTRAALPPAARRAAPVPPVSKGVAIGEFTFVPATRSVLRGDEERVLGAVDHALLAELCANPGTVRTRERLHEVVHGGGDGVRLRAIDAAVMRLRRLLEPDPAEPRYIRTVRGSGYMFVPRHSAHYG